MARFVLFLILLVPLTVAGNWLLDHPGIVRVDWLDYEIELHTAAAVLLVVLACLLTMLMAVAIWQLVSWPERRRARHRYRTMARGLQQVTHGLTALALGDESAAAASLKKARQTLPGEPLPQLLTAQLLQRQGKHDEARGEFRALLAHPSTAQLATHRLIEQHLTRREWLEATELALDARRDSPKDRWLALTLIDLYARQGNTAAIKSLTEGWHWQSPLSKAERHRYAAMAYVLAAREETTGKAQLAGLRQAYGNAPDFLPAIAAYTDVLIAQNDRRLARKILRSAWEKQPVPMLIPLILRSVVTVTPKQQQRLLAPFLKGDMAAHYLLAAEHALAVGEQARARQAAEAALSIEESKQACGIIAEAEKQLHGPEAATAWYARGMDAPAGRAWICQACGTAHAAWQPHCQHCSAFDSLLYAQSEARITSVEMTPVSASTD